MSEVTVTVRDTHRDVHTHIHGSDIDYLVAALSADPETIEELQAALKRYVHSHDGRAFFNSWRPGIDEEPWDAGLCIIDLAARLVLIDTTYSSPGPRGDVAIRIPDREDVMIPYHLADDWLFTRQTECWRGLADNRRRQRLANPPLDGRAILYSEVCPFIVGECARLLAEGPKPDDELYGIHRGIHAGWLTTTRDDLRGKAPRDILLERRGSVNWDLEDRCHQWSFLGAAPPPLSRETAAYRLGGFGTHEIVLYYYLVRHLVEVCWRDLATKSAALMPKLLEAEARRLAELRDTWLNSPEYETVEGRTPWSVIDKERIRMPEAMSGHDAIVDHDCPMCQMMADMPGPMFWHLDGCNFDDEFAFSFHRTQKEFDDERREWEEWNRKFNEEQAKKKGAPSVWQSSLSDPGGARQSPKLAIYGLASHLSELTMNLKDANADQGPLDELNRCFGNVRDVADPPNLDLLDPVVERMCEALFAVAADYPEFADKCNDLEQQLRTFADHVQNSPADDDLPF